MLFDVLVSKVKKEQTWLGSESSGEALTGGEVCVWVSTQWKEDLKFINFFES